MVDYLQGKKVEMKTLEGIVTRINAAGEKQTISSKCMDLDREVCTCIAYKHDPLTFYSHNDRNSLLLCLQGERLGQQFCLKLIFASFSSSQL